MKEFWTNWANNSLGQEVTEALSESAVENLKAPQTVPLVVYIGTDLRIVGTATIVGNEITGQLDIKDGDVLAQLVERGVIGSITASFKPAESYAPSFQGNYPGAKSISLPKKKEK